MDSVLLNNAVSAGDDEGKCFMEDLSYFKVLPHNHDSPWTRPTTL